MFILPSFSQPLDLNPTVFFFWLVVDLFLGKAKKVGHTPVHF